MLEKSSMGPHVVNQFALSTSAILLLLRQAAERAESLGIAVNIAVCDANAETCGFLRMQGAHVGAAGIATDKAWTSVGFGGASTRDIMAWLDGLSSHVARAAIIARPRYTPLPGGMPIWIAGSLVGAIGVAGGTPEQDEICSTAGFALIGATPTQRAAL